MSGGNKMEFTIKYELLEDGNFKATVLDDFADVTVIKSESDIGNSSFETAKIVWEACSDDNLC